MADEQLKQSKIPKQNKIKQTENKKIVNTPKAEEEIKKEETIKIQSENNEGNDIKQEQNNIETKDETKDDKKQKKVKKNNASIYGRNLPISLKHSIAIGRFIKNHKIETAILNLEKVLVKKIAVPTKGELAHRKGLKLNGKKMMSGKYPINASKEFIKLLKSLSANCTSNGMDIENTIIYEVIPNKSPKQFHRFGSTVFKRTHVIIKAKELKEKKSKDKK